MNEVICPVCKSSLSVNITVKENSVAFSLNYDGNDMHLEITTLFIEYLKDRNKINYHARFDQIGADLFIFQIKVYDGPQGDRWLNGVIKCNTGLDIEIKYLESGERYEISALGSSEFKQDAKKEVKRWN